MRRLFWDIETSPNVALVWRTGYKITVPHQAVLKEKAIIAITYAWDDGSGVKALTWDKDQCDRQMLIDFHRIASTADELVAHNGDRFDMPWFNARALKHGTPRLDAVTIDTLKIARKYFNFNSNTLEFLCWHLLGQKKGKTDLELWKRVMDGEPQAMVEMVDYARQDTHLLRELYHYMKDYIPNLVHAGVHAGGERWTCPRCANSDPLAIRMSKVSSTQAGMVRYQLRCLDCDRAYTVPTHVHRKWEEACNAD